jgi:hypothetical protein
MKIHLCTFKLQIFAPNLGHFRQKTLRLLYLTKISPSCLLSENTKLVITCISHISTMRPENNSGDTNITDGSMNY